MTQPWGKIWPLICPLFACKQQVNTQIFLNSELGLNFSPKFEASVDSTASQTPDFLPCGPPNLRVKPKWAEWIWGFAIGGSCTGSIHWHFLHKQTNTTVQKWLNKDHKNERIICTTITMMQTDAATANLNWSSVSTSLFLSGMLFQNSRWWWSEIWRKRRFYFFIISDFLFRFQQLHDRHFKFIFSLIFERAGLRFTKRAGIFRCCCGCCCFCPSHRLKAWIAETR